MKLTTACCFTILLMISSAAAQQSAPQSDEACGVARSTTVNWSQFHFDPCHTGYNPYETVLNPANVGNLVLDWNFHQSAEYAYSSPAMVDGVVYFGSSGDADVYALDARTGTIRWVNSCERSSFTAGSPTVAYGRVYVACLYSIRAFDAATGQVLWEVPDPFFDIPLPEITLSDGVLYVASYHMGNFRFNHMYALDARTGALLWKVSGQDWGVTTPAVANGMVYVGCDPGSLCAFDANTGVLVWEYTAEAYTSPAAVAGGVIYFASVSYVGNHRENIIYVNALNATTGALLWQHPVNATANATQDGLLSTPAIANGIVYIGSQNNSKARGHLYAVDASLGALLWRYDFAGTLDSTSPAVANGVVYFGSYDSLDAEGTVCALDAHTGRSLWKYTTDPVTSSLAVANGMLYVGTLEHMYAFHLPGQ